MENVFDLKKALGEKHFLRLIDSGFFKSIKKQPTIIYKHVFLKEIELMKSKDFFVYNLTKNKIKDSKEFNETNEILLNL